MLLCNSKIIYLIFLYFTSYLLLCNIHIIMLLRNILIICLLFYCISYYIVVFFILYFSVFHTIL